MHRINCSPGNILIFEFDVLHSCHSSMKVEVLGKFSEMGFIKLVQHIARNVYHRGSERNCTSKCSRQGEKSSFKDALVSRAISDRAGCHTSSITLETYLYKLSTARVDATLIIH